MDTLLLRYNLYVSAVVVAATTKEFEQDSALPALLCLQKGESWIGGAHKYQSEFSCAFLNLYCGVGMYVTLWMIRIWLFFLMMEVKEKL